MATKFNLRKFIKIAALVTLLLAVVEVVVIFILKEKKENPAVARKAVSRNNTSNANPETKAQSGFSQVDPSQEASVPVAKDSLSTGSNGYEAKPATTYQPVVNDTQNSKATNPSAPLKSKPKKSLRSLTGSEMNGILNDINAERKRLNIAAKCVQIQKTSNSNIDNAFAVADYLRSYGYVISGRSTVDETQAGIQFQAEGTCITVLIGKM